MLTFANWQQTQSTGVADGNVIGFAGICQSGIMPCRQRKHVLVLNYVS